MPRSRIPGLGADCRTTAVMRLRSGRRPNAMLGRERRAASNEPHPLDVHHCTVPWRSVTGG